MARHSGSWCLVTAVLVISAVFGAEARDLRICRADNHAVHMAATTRVVQLYHLIGEDPEILDFPNRRSLAEVVSGRCHAELGRVSAALIRYPDLIKVEIPVYYIRGYAYSLQPLPDIRNWSDIGRRSVGYILGEVHAETNLATDIRSPAQSYPGLVKLLDKGRVELIVGLDSGMGRIHNVERFHRSPAPLTNLPLYHLVRADMPDLARKLNRVAIKMEREQGATD